MCIPPFSFRILFVLELFEIRNEIDIGFFFLYYFSPHMCMIGLPFIGLILKRLPDLSSKG